MFMYSYYSFIVNLTVDFWLALGNNYWWKNHVEDSLLAVKELEVSYSEHCLFDGFDFIVGKTFNYSTKVFSLGTIKS